MEMFFFHPQQFDLLYNCTFYDITAIAQEQRQHIGMGGFFMLLSLFFEVMSGKIPLCGQKPTLNASGIT